MLLAEEVTKLVFGNNVERNFVLSTKSKHIERVQFVSTLSKGRHFTMESFDIVAVCGNKIECCCDNVVCCFDVVAGVDGALHRPYRIGVMTCQGRLVVTTSKRPTKDGCKNF